MAKNDKENTSELISEKAEKALLEDVTGHIFFDALAIFSLKGYPIDVLGTAISNNNFSVVHHLGKCYDPECRKAISRLGKFLRSKQEGNHDAAFMIYTKMRLLKAKVQLSAISEIYRTFSSQYQEGNMEVFKKAKEHIETEIEEYRDILNQGNKKKKAKES